MIYLPWLAYLLLFSRIVAFFSVVPFLNRRGIPVLIRVALSLAVAYLLFAAYDHAPQQAEGYYYLVSLVKEVLVGLALGYVVYLYFVLFQMAGQMIDYKSGLMMGGIFDPQFGSQVTFLGQFYYLLAIVVYLAVDGHHFLFKALADSFTLIPPASIAFQAQLVGEYVRLFAGVFRLAFQISAPVIIILFVVDIALGLIARTVPQFHVFMEGLPLKVVLSLAGIALVLPFLGKAMVDLFGLLHGDLARVIGGWQ